MRPEKLGHAAMVEEADVSPPFRCLACLCAPACLAACWCVSCGVWVLHVPRRPGLRDNGAGGSRKLLPLLVLLPVLMLLRHMRY